MSVTDKALLLKDDFDAVYEAGKKVGGGTTEPYAIYRGITSSGFAEVETVNMVSVSRGFMNGSNAGNTVKTLILNEGVRNLYQSSIYNCTSLTTVVLPSSLKQIFAYVFNACTALNNIILPKSVTSIQNGAFQLCSGITNFDVEDGFNCNLPLNTCANISQESVSKIITHYKESSGKIFTVHADVFANIPESEKTRAKNKGLSIASA